MLADLTFAVDVIKDYAADDATIEQILKDREKYPFRVAVVETLNKIRAKWTPGPGAIRFRSELSGPQNDRLKVQIKKEQEDLALAIIELELRWAALESVAEKRDKEPKRWQAHYDFAAASLKARLAYLNEYNKLLGNIVTETLPALDAKLAQDGWVLVASDTFKSGKSTKKMADDARVLFAELAVKHKGTPWAVQAKQEQAVELGLTWKAASLKGGK